MNYILTSALIKLHHPNRIYLDDVRSHKTLSRFKAWAAIIILKPYISSYLRKDLTRHVFGSPLLVIWVQCADASRRTTAQPTRLGAYIQLLREMNDLGLIKLPISDAGIDFVALTNMFKEGIISVTKAGQRFFEKIYTGEDTED